MLLLLSSMSWILSLLIMFLNHPLSFGFILLTQTIVIFLISGMLSLDYWFSYILFLIMVGGMLVLFIYMTSIASNEKFKFSKKIIIMFNIMFLFMLISLFSDNFILMMNTSSYDLMEQTNFNTNMSMNKYMNLPSMMILTLLMIYLLITLIAIVKITQSKMGTLRSL